MTKGWLMLRRVRLLGWWCVLVLLVGVAPAAAADESAPSAVSSGAASVAEPVAVLVAEPSDGPGVVVADDPARSVRYPLPVSGLADPDVDRAGLVSGSVSVDLAADTVVVAEGLPLSVELTDGKASRAGVSVLSTAASSGVSPLGVSAVLSEPFTQEQQEAAFDLGPWQAVARPIKHFVDIGKAVGKRILGWTP